MAVRTVLAVFTRAANREGIGKVDSVFLAAFCIGAFRNGQVLVIPGLDGCVLTGFGGDVRNLRVDIADGVSVLANFVGYAVELAAVYGISASAGNIAGCYVDNLSFRTGSADTNHACRSRACKATVFTGRAVGKGNGALRFIRSGPVSRI